MRDRLRRGLTAALLAAGVLTAAAGQADTTLNLTRVEAVALARSAYLAGNLALADAIARHLIQADPADVEALLILSAAEEALGHPEVGLEFGRRAWAAARAQGREAALRHEIARQTAHAALSAGRHFTTTAWLRRALSVAPGPEAAAATARDLAEVRQHSPLHFSFSASVSPTDNLNAGASTGLLAIDEIVVGQISGWSVAHAGFVANGQAGVTWDLGTSAGGRRQDSLSADLSFALHALTPAEQAANPTLDASDLDMTTARLSWARDFALPRSNRAGRWTLEASQTFYGGAPLAPGLRGSLDLGLPAAKGAERILTAVIERQWQDAPSNSVDGFSLGLNGSRQTPVLGGAMISYGLTGSKLDSDWSNTSYASLAAQVTLSPDARLGPFRAALTLGGDWRDYPVYSLGFANVTKGRTDLGAFLQLKIGLDQPRALGPKLTVTPILGLERRITTSNISKYDTRATTLTLGLAAAF